MGPVELNKFVSLAWWFSTDWFSQVLQNVQVNTRIFRPGSQKVLHFVWTRSHWRPELGQQNYKEVQTKTRWTKRGRRVQHHEHCTPICKEGNGFSHRSTRRTGTEYRGGPYRASRDIPKALRGRVRVSSSEKCQILDKLLRQHQLKSRYQRSIFLLEKRSWEARSLHWRSHARSRTRPHFRWESTENKQKRSQY